MDVSIQWRQEDKGRGTGLLDVKGVVAVVVLSPFSLVSAKPTKSI